MDQTLSPLQVARALGVSESSLKRWCDQGKLRTVRTPGGHRRIALAEVWQFVREGQHAVVEPQLLALPSAAERAARRGEGAASRLAEALLAGDEAGARAMVLDLYLGGQPLSRLCDEVIATAFHEIGHRWECREAEVYQERRSCQIVLRVLHELRTRMAPGQDRWTALGATLEGDWYSLPLTMGELVLRSIGWEARLLGASIPAESLVAAIQSVAPRLVWLSVSHVVDESRFVAGFQQLSEAAAAANTAIVVGGQALSAELRARLRFASYGDTMGHLEEFARALSRPTPRPSARSRSQLSKSPSRSRSGKSTRQ